MQWVTSTGGSGNSFVAAAAADAQGNLYIVGSTTSLDFPTVAAAQATPGGSAVTRIGLGTGAVSKLFPAHLPPISFAAVDPQNPATLYVASSNQIWKSTDAGSTWSMTYAFAANVQVFSLAVAPGGTGTVYAGTTTSGVYKSVDGGMTFRTANGGLPTQANGTINIETLFSNPALPDTMFVSAGGSFARSTDSGSSWSTVLNRPVQAVVFDPFTPGTLYVSIPADGSLLKSSDNGQTFTPLSQLLTFGSANSLAADPQRAGVLYAASLQGILESTDSGVTWNLKLPGRASALVADPGGSAFYFNLSNSGLVKTTDAFATITPVGPRQPAVKQLLVSGSTLFEISLSSTDAFAVKLDNRGQVVYATYFGGNGADAAVALAVGADGSLFLTGSTTSLDLPVTPGAYSLTNPSTNGSAASFVTKLNPDGSLAWASYFTGPQSTVASMAVDSAGNPLVGGHTTGNHPTTPGAYQGTFQQSLTCTGFIGCFPGATAGFVTKFSADGTGLIYSTYVATDTHNNVVQGAQAMTVDASGNAWIGVGTNPNLVVGTVGTNVSALELNPTGSAVVASAVQPGLGSVSALALDADSNLYIAGTYSSGPTAKFAATPGAFQPAPQPVIPFLPYGPFSGGGLEAFVAKFDPTLTNLLASTLLGGEASDTATSVAIDSEGRVIVGGFTESSAFPTEAPFQESFSGRSGFVAAFDSNLSKLLFSTYLGDQRLFAVRAAIADGNGNIVLAGSTLSTNTAFLASDINTSTPAANLVIANQIALPAAPSVRLDSVQNYASRIANPLAPGEPIIVMGSGFGADAQLVLDGRPLATISSTHNSLVAAVPDTANTSGTSRVQVLSGGVLSNSVLVRTAAAAPAIYSTDGSGAGQGYILNTEGTLNSPTNPAAMGSAVTIFAAGPGQYDVSNGYAVTSLTPAVFVDGFYCNGIAASIGPVDGFPGNVYRISVMLPDLATLVKNNPDLKSFQFPAQSAVTLVMGAPNSATFANSPVGSQSGVFINLAQ